MAAADAQWQRLPKARRAAVYRAIGRAARIAREDRDAELSQDLRTIMNVLRAHAVGARTKRAGARTRSTTSTRSKKSTRSTKKRGSRTKR
jgi:hypothetical protein